MQKTLLVVVGPTAVGKTAVAISLAKHFQTEIISADSRQVYREMKIGTARPDETELQDIPHHLLGHISIHQPYSVADFVKEANEKIALLFTKYNLVILTGGSGLYVDALCNGLDDLPDSDPAIKSKLTQTLNESGIEVLQQQLLKLDPVYYNQIDLNNPHRLMRAIEVCLITGKKFSELRSGKKAKHDYRILKIGLNLERNKLYEQINQRVLNMMEMGLLNEVKSLLPHQDLKALKTVGYSELFDFLQNKSSIEVAIQHIQQNTRRYAKRQLTWFRKDTEIHWFEPHNKDLQKDIEALL